ncbi:histidinol-phosphate transaminase [Umboniibacter marinipuniceus]|uniref:Histidinol-phosphate aminotransferase n=1 Tax=Umboniibacter marinipuniceus TaxID=569599 RepID=A0A3M0A376_9GAMM|nr:histidinol-phosphate transaminase [Umboniibacter marinipuniceus]RMA79433.1 histidinol phosphate aminotransferase [Umboniibacter marinipuniceus]
MSRIKRVIRPELLAQSAYHVQSSQGLLKLDAMESPFKLSGELLQQWLQAISSTSLNRYPDPTAGKAAKRFAEVFALAEDEGILFGNGSDELLQILIQAVAADGTKVLAPSPSFVMYETLCLWNRIEFVGVDLNADFSLNMPAMLEQINTHQPALIFLAQPNNPTANNWAVEDLQAIVECAEGLVVIDEAYYAYSDRHHLEWIRRYDNVVIVRTLSKQGFAGIRLGMLIAKQAWLDEFNKVRMPYNINVLTQATAEFVADAWEPLGLEAGQLAENRQELSDSLVELGLEVFPSQANFLVVRTAHEGALLCNELKARGVLIKNLCGTHPLFKHCVRITVSSISDNTLLLSAIESSLENLTS